MVAATLAMFSCEDERLKSQESGHAQARRYPDDSDEVTQRSLNHPSNYSNSDSHSDDVTHFHEPEHISMKKCNRFWIQVGDDDYPSDSED